MAAINDLIAQIEDIALRERIAKEVDRLSKQKKFGLVFEEHLPECTPLYDIPVKAGALVAKKAGEVNDVYKALCIADNTAQCLHRESKEIADISLDDIVTVAEFGEPIYPYLKPLDSVCNAPDSDLWHTLIEADNYHALQLLEYLYAGKVDCIYIDPPYNTGAKDWKYNNNYVDGNDAYRHSKWLSFMQRRLQLAKKLLNPTDSVLIVTIDEKEYLHLGCLLEEMFPEGNMQMISSVIKNGTSMRQYEFSRCNEYIFYLRFGDAIISKEIPENVSTDIPWRPLMRSGTGSNNFRPNRPNSFYPIFWDKACGNIHHIGDPLLPAETSRLSISVPDNLIAIWPLDSAGRERVWGASAETLREYFKKGYAKVTHKGAKYSVQYITTGVINDIDTGKLNVTGKDSDGGIVGTYSEGKAQMPQNQWNIPSHNATTYGTNLLKDIVGNRFTFPKSLYAVHDCLKHSIREKKDALVIDFFSGSGTTLHKVEADGIKYTDHLFANADGVAKIKLNGWEQAVLAEEQKREDYVCWLRNPSRQAWALRMPYEIDGKCKEMYPDFIIVRRDPILTYVIDILEPHNPDFKDNLGKAKGLANYAANEPRIGRVQLIRIGKDAAKNDRFKRLDLAKGTIRNKVLAAINTDELDHIFDTDGVFED